MESKGNFHLQPVSCATWPLHTLAVQGALPGTVKTRACAGSFLSVPVGPHWTPSSRAPPTWVHLFSAEQQQYQHSRYLMHQVGEKTSWKHYWGWYGAKIWRNFLNLHAKCRNIAGRRVWELIGTEESLHCTTQPLIKNSTWVILSVACHYFQPVPEGDKGCSSPACW